MTEKSASPAFSRADRDEVDREQHDDAAGMHGLVGEEAADRVHIRRGALDQLAGLRLVVIAERQPLDVIVQVIAQALRDAFGGLRREPPAPKREEALQQRQPDETQRNRQQDRRRVDALAEHIVDQVGQQHVGQRIHHARPGR